MRHATILVLAALPLLAMQARAQTMATGLDPDSAEIELLRLGATSVDALAQDDELLPGDELSNLTAGVVLELTCPIDSNNTYILEAPFRVIIDVAGSTGCHIDMLAGSVDVQAEEPTGVSIGGVEMTSIGTQYAVRVSREDEEVNQKLLVYDGKVDVHDGDQEEIVAGGREWARVGRNKRAVHNSLPQTELNRSAAVYSRLDVSKAVRSPEVESRDALYAKLNELHRSVMKKPDDEKPRVRLAKAQIENKINNRAVYHLKRAGVMEARKYEAYNLDMINLREGLSSKNLEYLDRARRGPDVGGPVAPVVKSDADRALDYVRNGQPQRAIELMITLVRSGKANSRDYYALAKAWQVKGERSRARRNLGKARELHGRDGILSDRELREVRRLLGRL